MFLLNGKNFEMPNLKNENVCYKTMGFGSPELESCEITAEYSVEDIKKEIQKEKKKREEEN